MILSDLVPVGDTGGSDPGDFVADAVRFTPYASVERFAAWTLPIATPDTYEVFAKWAPRADLASDATFHVYHDGGITDVVVDQTLGDGAWLSLGTFALTPGPGAKVTLGDQANGPVAADAIAAVPAAQGGSALFTWTPNLPSTGVYEVYARYVAGSERSSDAAYAVTHASGTTNVSVDQRHNGGTWLSLGSHTFNAGTAGSVDLATCPSHNPVSQRNPRIPSHCRSIRYMRTRTSDPANTLDLWAGCYLCKGQAALSEHLLHIVKV